HGAGARRRAAGPPHVGAVAQTDLRRRHRRARAQDAGLAGVGAETRSCTERSAVSSSPTAARSPSGSSAPRASSACARWRVFPKRIASRAIASPLTRAISSAPAGRRSRPISTWTTSSAWRAGRAWTRFTPATDFSPPSPSSPPPARRPASPSSVRAPRRCARPATSSRRARWRRRWVCACCPRPVRSRAIQLRRSTSPRPSVIPAWSRPVALEAAAAGPWRGSALPLARAAHYAHAGAVEFLLDADTRVFYFIEVNPRLQVEHTVADEVTGIDIVKAQLRIAAGARIGGPASGLPSQEAITLSGHALQCRVTTEDPANGFAPVPGRLDACRLPAGFGIRVDAGSAHTGAIVSAFYDSLLMKIVARGDSPDEAIGRMARALGETRVNGVASNLPFLERVITHPAFAGGKCTTTFVDETPELFEPVPAPDGA